MQIGIAGAKGSFSEEAARHYAAMREEKNGSTVAYLIGVEQVLEALSAGRADVGIFPIENSNGGVVLETVHAMSRFVFEIERLFDIEVKHNVLVRPGVTAAMVNAIVSHDQALRQCRMYLRRAWPETELREYADTAQAAADLGEEALPETTAVIAPAICAELYGLEILEASVQDLKFNLTTFVAAKRAGE